MDWQLVARYFTVKSPFLFLQCRVKIHYDASAGFLLLYFYQHMQIYIYKYTYTNIHMFLHMFLHIHTRAFLVRTSLHINSNVSTFQTAPLNGGTFCIITGAKSAGCYVTEAMKFSKHILDFKAIERITKRKFYEN